jgi:hypothetical protein
MIILVRLLRVVVILVLAVVTLSFVVGIGSSTTGWIEKVVLLGLVGACVYAAAQVTTLATRVEDRLRH